MLFILRASALCQKTHYDAMDSFGSLSSWLLELALSPPLQIGICRQIALSKWGYNWYFPHTWFMNLQWPSTVFRVKFVFRASAFSMSCSSHCPRAVWLMFLHFLLYKWSSFFKTWAHVFWKLSQPTRATLPLEFLQHSLVYTHFLTSSEVLYCF